MEERKSYSFEDGNAVRDLPYGSAVPKQEPELLPQNDSGRIGQSRKDAGNQVHERTSPARQPQTVSLSAVAGFLLVAVLAVAVLSTNIRLNSLYSAAVAQRHQLIELESEYSKLQAADEEIFDNESLKRVAEESGLVKPGVNQQVYLKLSPPSNTVVYGEQDRATGLAGVVQWFERLFGITA